MATTTARPAKTQPAKTTKRDTTNNRQNKKQREGQQAERINQQQNNQTDKNDQTNQNIQQARRRRRVGQPAEEGWPNKPPLTPTALRTTNTRCTKKAEGDVGRSRASNDNGPRRKLLLKGSGLAENPSDPHPFPPVAFGHQPRNPKNRRHACQGVCCRCWRMRGSRRASFSRRQGAWPHERLADGSLWGWGGRGRRGARKALGRDGA